MYKLAAFVALMLGLLASPVAAQNPFAAKGEPVVIGRGFDVPSRRLGDRRRVNVMLPPGYDAPENRGRRYPVLYLLDGGAEQQDFFHIAGLVHQGSLWGISAPLILVGIESKDRRRELTTPSSDPRERKDFPTHGKADAFRDFLVDELKPRIDDAYRTDGTDTLMGESLAGLFVVETALRHGRAFDRYVAVSPSLWWDQGRLAREAPRLLAASDPAPRILWLTIGSEGAEMQHAMDRLVAALRTNTPGGMRWTYAPMPGEAHNTIYHPAATRAIRTLFPPAAAR